MLEVHNNIYLSLTLSLDYIACIPSITQGLAPSIPVEFNFGISRPFIFDVIAFEEQQLLEANFPSSSGANRESNSNSTGSSSSTYNQYSGGDSKDPSSPGNRGCYSDPWRYYEHQVEDQEAKQRVTRHPKYKNCRWDSSNRTSEAAVPAVSGQGQGQGHAQGQTQTQGMRAPVTILSSSPGLGAGTAIGRIAGPDATYGMHGTVSGASSSSSPSARYSTVNHAVFEQSNTEISVSQDSSQDGIEGFEAMNETTPHGVTSMNYVARTGRGGRGGHFLSAKRQYTYISRSAKLERLTTIISAANGPFGSNPHTSSLRKSPITASASSSSTIITNSGKKVLHDAQDEKRKLPYNRDKGFAEKVKKKRKSLFLNPHLRAATLSEISSTCRVSPSDQLRTHSQCSIKNHIHVFLSILVLFFTFVFMHRFYFTSS